MSDSATTPASDAPLLEPVERFEPGHLQGELVEAEHLARYYWAAGVARDQEVLDAGCGTGYGCAILADVGGAKRCAGVDIAGEAIGRAADAHGDDERLEFCVGDVTALPFEDASFDVVTCFETIEHVEEHQRVVSELARVLRPGGLLLTSSPNRDEYPPGNPYHVRELTADEFHDLLSGAFDEVQLFRQHNWLASAILDDETFSGESAEARLELDARKLQGRKRGRELYTLAACGDRPIDPPRQQALLTHGLEVRRWLGEIRRLGDELTETRKALAACEQELLELRDRRSTAMGQLERQAYWLQRAEIDPEALMRRRLFRLAFRAFQIARRIRRRLVGRG